MTVIRNIRQVFSARPTMEGAGVRLHRVFGYGEVLLFDPFLMLDDFRSDRPDQYLPGFPWHPHRGIETVTYMLDGKVEHGDSMDNAGSIGAGDVQWMTAGSGIIHQEMPKPVDGKMGGFQLWVNLPAAEKMMQPRYQEVKAADIPVLIPEPGVRIRIVAGSLNDTAGPVRDIIADPLFLEVALDPGVSWTFPTPAGHTFFAYVFAGSGIFSPGSPAADEHMAVLYEVGDAIRVSAGNEGVRFLCIGGQPIREPVAWRGPIVMNTDEELRTAFRELQEGTFIKFTDTHPGIRRS